MDTTISISSVKKSSLIEGTCGYFDFKAQVSAKPSDDGIKCGRVLNLKVKRATSPWDDSVIEYNLGWETLTLGFATDAAHAIINHLETLNLSA